MRMKLSELNVDFRGPNPDPFGSSKLAQAGVKDCYSANKGYFTAICSCSVKTVADTQTRAAYHNKQ